MSINTDNDGISPKYLGNGISKNFTFDFRVFAQTEISVKKTSATGVITILVYGTDYTVALNANQNNNPGGSITTTIAPITGESLVIISQVPYTQLTTLTTQGNFDPVVLNDTHDKSTVLAQQLRGQILLSLKIPDADGASLNTTLPSAVNRAGKVLKFETNGGVGVSQYDVDTVVNQVNQLATQASNSASQASSSAGQASTSATNAGISATSATNSANQASSSAASATNSAIQAQAYANSLQWSGTVTVSTNTILDATYSGEMIVVNTTAGNITLTLPLISSLTLPVVFGIKKGSGDANKIIINPSESNTINQLGYKDISTSQASVSLIPNISGNWEPVDASLPSSGGGGGQQSIYFCGTTTTVSNIWTASNPNITSLYDGLVVQVKFDTVTSNTTQLNLNNFGAKFVLAGGTNTYNSVYNHLNTSNLFTLVYYQNNWYVESSNMVGIDNVDFNKDIKISYATGIIPAPTLTTASSSYNKITVTNNATYIGITSSYNLAGTIKIIEFVNSAILQHNATSFILPTGANITTNTGDVAIFIKIADSNNYWKCINYFKVNGEPLENGILKNANVNVDLSILQQQRSSVLSVRKFFNSVYDHFIDQTGILNNTGGTYTSSLGGYYYNPLALGNSFFTGGTASASASTGAYTPNLAFDNSPTTGWFTDSGGANAWLKYDLGASVTRILTYMSLQGSSSGSAPQSFLVQGSNDDTNWTTLYTSTTLSWASTTETKNFSIANTTAYRWYRLYMTPVTFGFFGITEWYGYQQSSSNITLTSVVSTASQSFNKVSVIVLYQPVATSVINTDCTIEINRNSGSNWVTVILTELFTDSDNLKVLSGVADLSAQPVGTGMQWRFKTLNNKEQRINAVAMEYY
jgi:hypothetical protein